MLLYNETAPVGQVYAAIAVGAASASGRFLSFWMGKSTTAELLTLLSFTHGHTDKRARAYDAVCVGVYLH